MGVWKTLWNVIPSIEVSSCSPIMCIWSYWLQKWWFKDYDLYSEERTLDKCRLVKVAYSLSSEKLTNKFKEEIRHYYLTSGRSPTSVSGLYSCAQEQESKLKSWKHQDFIFPLVVYFSWVFYLSDAYLKRKYEILVNSI